MALSPTHRLGPYEILAPIGAGGMDEVYKARDTRLDRTVAIKTSKTEFSERLTREARACVGAEPFQHLPVVRPRDLPGGGGYLVMEFIDGSPIPPSIPHASCSDLVVQISDGMADAHSAGLTHRGLKPDDPYHRGQSRRDVVIELRTPLAEGVARAERADLEPGQEPLSVADTERDAIRRIGVITTVPGTGK